MSGMYKIQDKMRGGFRTYVAKKQYANTSVSICKNTAL